jgi:aryl-alcohol dehydrogenase-like predicted oxidoreductase
MIPRRSLDEGYDISRIIKGGWHLAGDHGAIDRAQALADMAAFVEAGITTFDCADIYTGVEQMIGDFRRAYPDHAELIQIHTKFVPDLADLPRVDATYVARIIDRSLTRLGVERIDLVQFHWWDYATPRYVDAALELDRQRRAGKIARLGVTNFDVPHLAAMVEAGVSFATNQVQYSLLDRRPQNGMVAYCQSRQIALLCYGTVAGGFLSERWLGQPEPVGPLTNRSLVKYKLIIDDFGGWEAFQGLLGALSRIAAKHGVDIASIATAAIINRPCVAAAIVGATNAGHLASHAKIGALKLDPSDVEALDVVTRGASGPLGDIYALERDRHGPHGRIMKYELNKV